MIRGCGMKRQSIRHGDLVRIRGEGLDDILLVIKEDGDTKYFNRDGIKVNVEIIEDILKRHDLWFIINNIFEQGLRFFNAEYL